MTQTFAHHAGVDLAYEVDGPEHDAPTLLLIMGIQMRRAHWGTHFIDALARHFRVVSFDNRGTGDSTKPVEEITAALWAGDALAVLDAVGAARAHVLGFSMGGRIAQELVVTHPERVQRLVLLSSAVGGPEALDPEPRAMASFMPRPDVSPEQARREGLCAVTGPDFASTHPERLSELVDIGARQATPLRVLQRQIGVLRHVQIDALPLVQHPTRIVHGDADSLVPFGNGELLARLMPAADFIRLPGIGHLPHWECPERLVALIEEFLLPR